ncbi:hypothetical protein FN846DRAFT_906814 [Sphaerosporella brunnea]|uniref:Uncharacterized protein n=1 Tax=Sphaerosporella brunnea TaxID=1250544 RepID=A0A5J5EXG7_9PEZI|nr:hypothetical protein FN846DRAFT_906814 [Sphaerosporella brunnea]
MGMSAPMGEGMLSEYLKEFGIEAPALKFVVPGDDRIRSIPLADAKTYGGMKMAVEDKLQIVMDSVLDPFNHPIEPTDWEIVSSTWPYRFGKFTVVGQPMFSDPVMTVVWEAKSLAIKMWLPSPRRITMGQLLTIVRGYLVQLLPSPLDLSLAPRMTRSEINNVIIQDGWSRSRDLVRVVQQTWCTKCLQQSTVFVGTTQPKGVVGHSHSAASTEPQMVFVVVQNLWEMIPGMVKQYRPDLLVPATLTVSEVKAIIEKQFWDTLGLEDEDERDEVLWAHEMLTAAADGCWDKIADQDTMALGNIRMAVRSIITYKE